MAILNVRGVVVRRTYYQYAIRNTQYMIRTVVYDILDAIFLSNKVMLPIDRLMKCLLLLLLRTCRIAINLMQRLRSDKSG